MINQCRQSRTRRQVWLGVRKMFERFGILGKFKARFVDLLNLQLFTLTKPTGLNKPTGLTTFWKIDTWLEWLGWLDWPD